MVALSTDQGSSVVGETVRRLRAVKPRNKVVRLPKLLGWVKRFGRVTAGLGTFVAAGFQINTFVGLVVGGFAWFALDFLLDKGGKA